MNIRRLTLVILASLGALVAASVFLSASALSAPVAPTIGGESVLNVASTSLTFQAQINPGGADTTYRFEYGTVEGVYGTSVPEPNGDVGAGESEVSVSVHTQEDLAPGVTYHYRIAAVNEVGTVSGPDRTFTTQPASGDFVLPDARQYEMVSPPDKEGSEVTLSGLSGGNSAQASADGTKVAYLAKLPFANPSAYSTDIQMLSTRGANEWTSQNISPPHSVPTGIAATGPEFGDFSADLSHGAVVPFGGTSLSPLAREGYWIGYLRDNLDGSYEPLLTTAPEAAKIAKPAFRMKFSGGNPSLDHIVLESSSGLTSNAGTTGGIRQNLYEWTKGRLQLVSVLPGGESSGGGGVFVGISEDGTRILWTHEQALFVRDITTGITTSLGGSGAQEGAVITKDGSKVFFVGEEGQLYVADLDSPSQASTLISGGDPSKVEEVVGASANGAYVYYMDGLESGGDVYVAHNDGTSWETTLISSGGVARGELGGHPTRFKTSRESALAMVTSNGQYLGYSSSQFLGTQEVYVYDASSHHLVCASCNPTAAQPLGESEFESMSESGRTFFDSDDALVAHDTNGNQDVYEWEPESVGGCQAAPGCAYLISNGTSNDRSSFIGASASGDDIFFSTRASLSPWDFDSSFDVYDAHVCTTLEPCLEPPVAPPACTSNDACKAAPTPQPTIFGAPASSTFSGAGNIATASTSATKSKPRVKGKSKKRHAGAKSKKRKAKKARAGKGLSRRAKR